MVGSGSAKVGLFLTVVALSSMGGCFGQSTTVTSIAVHPERPEILYVTTNDRIYKSRDGGRSWAPVVEGMSSARVLSLAIHPAMHSTVYAGTFGDAVYRSLDGGRRWSIINAGLKEHVTVVNAFVFHPENPETIFAGATVGIFKTTDGGMLWEEMSNKGMDSVYVVSLVIDSADHDILYAGTSGGVYRSRDGGRVWEPVSRGMIERETQTGLALGVNSLVQDPARPSILYAGTTRGAFRTDNRGESWTPIRGGLIEGFIASLLPDPRNIGVVYAGTSRGVFKSTDGGQSWSMQNEGLANLNIRCLAMDSKDSKVLYAGTHGGLFKTTDGGESWRRLDLKNVSAEL